MRIATFTHHHRSERSNWKAKADSREAALVLAAGDEFGIKISEDQARDAIAKAVVAGEAAIALDPEDHGEDSFLTVWYEAAGAETNFGCGEGSSVDETEKHRNVWIKLEDWQPEEGQRERYLALEKEVLVDLLLERDALA